VVAIGGGGFSTLGKVGVVEDYVLGLAVRDRPKVCFLPTAGDAEARIENFYASFAARDCETSHLPLFRTAVADIESFLAGQDVIFVGGGNTRNMLLLWHAWGVDAALRHAWHNGVILAGVSAGAICWFEGGLTDSFPAVLRPLPGLGWIRGSFCPHYDSEPGRRAAFADAITSGALPAGYAVDDHVALHFSDGRLVTTLSSEPGRMARYVSLNEGNVVEQALPLDGTTSSP
jgi:peptidase E